MAQESLAELTDSIRARGVLQPLLVRPHPNVPDRFQLIAGERRWRAAREAGLAEVPVLVQAMTDGEAMASALVENLQRQDLNALEEADGYRRLLEEFGLTQEALAQAVGKSRSHVANTLRLLGLSAALREALRGGVISAGHARALLGHPDPERALGHVIAHGLNVRQTERLAAAGPPEAAMDASPDRHATLKDADTRALEVDVSAHLGLRVEIQSGRGQGGSIRITYRSLDQLEGVVALLMR